MRLSFYALLTLGLSVTNVLAFSSTYNSSTTTTNPQITVTPTLVSTTTTTSSATATTGTGCVPSPPWGALKPRSTGPPIRALDGWAAGSFLQKDAGSSAAKLGPSSSRGWFVTATSIRLVYICPSFLYLNILEASTSYKPLAFEATGVTFSWTFSSTDGTIGTTTGAHSFVACSTGDLYLQTGSDLPQGNCTTTRLTLFPET
ncbi:hypothetical protein BDV93DRAFT_609868 [Ceratobasidium sp. AG-I]|nr:hypothetical protein BDV93DRAFT_609868 [Ceratobasidium sp. AG-I]